MSVTLALALSLSLIGQEAAAAPVDAAQPAPAAEAQTAAPAPSLEEPPLPPGAPTDDYGLVNWCWGALNAHMALYPRVRDQLDPAYYDADEQQMAAGRAYLDLYRQAILAADSASPDARAAQAQAGRNAGANVFAGADNVSAVQLKWAYLGWSLPGRCEVAARRMLASSELMAPALRSSSAAAAGVGVTAPAAPTTNTAEPVEPGPAQPVDPTAEPAPQ